MDWEEEAEGEGDGEGALEGEGEDEGEDEPEDGSAWQFVLVLAEAVALSAAATGPIVPACAVPDTLACTASDRKPAVSNLSAPARTCAKRIRIACLRCSELLSVLRGFGGDWVTDGHGHSYPMSG